MEEKKELVPYDHGVVIDIEAFDKLNPSYVSTTSSQNFNEIKSAMDLLSNFNPLGAFEKLVHRFVTSYENVKRVNAHMEEFKEYCSTKQNYINAQLTTSLTKIENSTKVKLTDIHYQHQEKLTSIKSSYDIRKMEIDSWYELETRRINADTEKTRKQIESAAMTAVAKIKADFDITMRELEDKKVFYDRIFKGASEELRCIRISRNDMLKYASYSLELAMNFDLPLYERKFYADLAKSINNQIIYNTKITFDLLKDMMSRIVF